MSEAASLPVQNCTVCGTEVDVAQCEPLASVECPICGTPMLVSKNIGGYELVEVMGRGGMGVVYRAIDHQLDRQVALKVLREDFLGDSEFIRKLDEEAAITGGINHPHVVKVYTTGTVQGRFFIAMELVDKGTLDDLLEVQGRVAEAQALEIASQIAQGLRAAHQLGLIHRDVKPGNILFAGSHQAKIVDFGLAMLEEASKGSDEIWGTPYYVSPERLDQKPEDFRSDIYSLGATMFHAIAGRPPFEAEDAGRVALKHLKSQAVSLQAFAPWVAGSTAFVINRMLAKDPSARYDSYDELIEHLEYARTELAQGTKAVQKQRVVLETDEDRKLWGQVTFAVLALVLLLGLGTGAYLLFGRAKPPPQAGTVLSTSVGATGKFATDFEAAHKLLVEDKPQEAAAAFHQISVQPGVPPGLAHWCLLQEALGHLFSGSLPQARAALTTLLQQKVEPTAPAARLQEEFMGKVANLVIDPKPVSNQALIEFNRASYGALAVLIGGLKDWELEDFDNANTALRSFQSAAPTGEFIWINDYKKLLEDYVNDLSDYRGAMMLAKNANTQTELKEVAQTIAKLKTDLRKGAAKLGPKLDAAAAEALKRSRNAPPDATSTGEAEKTTLAALRTKTGELAKQWKFAEARTEVAGTKITTVDLEREQRILARKLDWLAQFKATLIKDLGKGYSGSVKLANNSPLPAPIVSADENGVTFGPPEARKSWAELAPSSVCAIANSFLTSDMTGPAAVDRHWWLGCYAAFARQRDDARKHLQEGTRSGSPYEDFATVLLPPRREDLARSRNSVITASDSSSPTEGPANATDGKNETRWASSRPGEKWLQLDLGKECTVYRWVVRHAHSNNEPAEANTVDFSLQSSGDGKQWREVDPVRGNVLDQTDRRLARFQSRYLRLLITKPNRLPGDNPTAHIYALEVYGWEAPGDVVGDYLAPGPMPLPEFIGADIGATEFSGSTMVDEGRGIFLVRSSGAGVGGSADSCRYLHTAVRGESSLTVRIDAVEQASPRSEAGLMVRGGLQAGDPSVYLGVSAAGQVIWAARKEPGGAAVESRELKPATFPCWLRLEHKGGAWQGAWSKDGKAWSNFGSEVADFGPDAEIGVAVMSHAPKAFAGARFEIINFLR